MRVAIVGSRRRNTLADLRIVTDLVERLVAQHGKITIVSGGCPRGADNFAEQAARIFTLPVIVHRIPPGSGTMWEFTRRAHSRNELIARDADEIYALVHPDRTGGTENTVAHGLRLKKPVYLVLEDGSTYLSQEKDIDG